MPTPPFARTTPWIAAVLSIAAAASAQRAPEPDDDPFHGNAFPPPEASVLGIDLEGMIRAGYRAVSVSGNRDRYGVDLRRDPGMRVRDVQLRGSRGLFGFAVAGSNIGDPLYDLEGQVAFGPVALTGSESRRPIAIAGEGPFPRVDQNRRRRAVDLSVGGPAIIRIGATRDEAEGFYRAAVPGQGAPSTAPPPDGFSSTPEFGMRDTFSIDANTPFVQLGYRRIDEETRSRWLRPGPGLGNQVRTQEGDVGIAQLGGRESAWPWRDRAMADPFDRAEDADAEAQSDADPSAGLPAGLRVPSSGFPAMLAVEYGDRDFSQISAGSGSASGQIENGSVEFGLSLHVGEVIDAPGLSVQLEGAIDDYAESGTLTQLTAAALPQNLDQRRQQYSARLRWTNGESFTADLGAGLTRDEVEGIQQNGAVGTRAGVVHSAGVEAMISWKPAPRWILGAGYRGHGDGALWRTQRWQPGAPSGRQPGDFANAVLDPMIESRYADRLGTLGAASARYAGERIVGEVQLSHRSSDSDEGLLDLDQKRIAARIGLRPREDVAFDALYVFNDVDSRALTSAWFDPEPGILPNLLAYDGQTHRVAASLRLQPSAIVDWRFELGWNKGDGTLAVDLWDWSAGVSVDVRYGMRLGVELAGWDYEEAGPGDWDSQMVWVFGEARLGGG